MVILDYIHYFNGDLPIISMVDGDFPQLCKRLPSLDRPGYRWRSPSSGPKMGYGTKKQLGNGNLNGENHG